MDSDEKDTNAGFESENEDDGLSSEDDEEQQHPLGAMHSEKMSAELGQGNGGDLDYMEGDGELVEGDASPTLGSLVEKQECGETDMSDCRVEDTLDEDHAEFIQSLKVWGNADQIERELVKMPSAEDAVDEVKCTRDDRCITLHPFGLDDFSNPKFLAALREKGCEEIRHQFVRPEANRDEWEGFVLLNFGSVSSALRAAEELKDFRDGVEVKVQIQGSQSSHRWSDGLLVVKNIGESTSESKLSTLFPGGSILLHRESSLNSDGALKGLAYVVYAAKEEADEVLARYNGKKIILDGRRLVVMKYFNPEKTLLPEGMLRLGERRLVMHNITELNEMIDSANRDTSPLQKKVEALQDLIDKDDHIRHQIGLPTPSFDRLSKMNSLRQFSEREKTTILQRLLNPPPPPAPPTPSKPEAPKAENGEKCSAAKTVQAKKRKNKGKKSSKETTVVVPNLNTPPPVLPLFRPAFVPRLQGPPPALMPGQQVRAPFPPLLRGAAPTSLMRAPFPSLLRGAAPTSQMRAPLPTKAQPLSIGNWMQPPPIGVPPPAMGPLGTKPLSRIPVSVAPPPVSAPTMPPPRSLMNLPTGGNLSRVPQQGPFVPRPPRGFAPGSMPPWRVPPPTSGAIPRPLLGMSSEVLEPPVKRARFDRPPVRPLLGSLSLPNFRQQAQQRRF